MPQEPVDPFHTTIKSLQDDRVISDKLAFYCYQAGIYTLRQLVLHQLHRSPFVPLPGSTPEDAQVLRELCIRTLDHLPGDTDTQATPTRKELNAFIDHSASQLSVRAGHAIALLRQSIPDPQAFLLHLFTHRDRLQDIRNVGKKTIMELTQWIDLLERAMSVGVVRERESFVELEVNELADTLRLPRPLARVLYDQYHRNTPMLLGLLENICTESGLLESNAGSTLRLLAQQNTYIPGVWINDVVSRQRLSRERVRQIKNSLPKRFLTILDSIAQTFRPDKVLSAYPRFAQPEFIIIDDITRQALNQAEQTSLSAEMIGIGIAWMRQHNLELWVSKKHHAYLSNPRLFRMADLVLLLAKIGARIDLKRSSPEKADVAILVPGFSSHYGQDYFPSLQRFILHALEYEFGLIANDLDDVYLPATKKQKKIAAILAVMEAASRPMRLEEIAALLPGNMENPPKTLTALRSQLILSDEVITFSRTSTYGLKKWESEQSNIRGGSLRDMVLAFLEAHENPVHQRELMAHLATYREVTWNNIAYNLRQDSKKRFVFFRDGFLGLQAKTYPGWEPRDPAARTPRKTKY